MRSLLCSRRYLLLPGVSVPPFLLLLLLLLLMLVLLLLMLMLALVPLVVPDSL